MVYPIYHKNTVLYGDNGVYTLIEKKGDKIKYKFEPWAKDGSVIDEKTINELSTILKRRLLWAVWEDDPICG